MIMTQRQLLTRPQNQRYRKVEDLSLSMCRGLSDDFRAPTWITSFSV